MGAFSYSVGGQVFRKSRDLSWLARTPKGAYSPRGRSRHLLETPFSEPLLRILLRTPFTVKTHRRPPSQNPSENPFPRTLSRTFSEPFSEKQNTSNGNTASDNRARAKSHKKSARSSRPCSCLPLAPKFPDTKKQLNFHLQCYHLQCFDVARNVSAPKSRDLSWCLPSRLQNKGAGRTRGRRILPQNPSPKKGQNSVCPFHDRSHREICTRNRPVSETKFLDDSGGPFSPGPFGLLLLPRDCTL